MSFASVGYVFSFACWYYVYVLLFHSLVMFITVLCCLLFSDVDDLIHSILMTSSTSFLCSSICCVHSSFSTCGAFACHWSTFPHCHFFTLRALHSLFCCPFYFTTGTIDLGDCDPDIHSRYHLHSHAFHRALTLLYSILISVVHRFLFTCGISFLSRLRAVTVLHYGILFCCDDISIFSIHSLNDRLYFSDTADTTWCDAFISRYLHSFCGGTGGRHADGWEKIPHVCGDTVVRAVHVYALHRVTVTAWAFDGCWWRCLPCALRWTL